MSEVLNVEEIFGEQVFTLGKMKERLPKKVFQEVKQIMDMRRRAVSGNRRRGGKGDEGLGSGERSNPLHPLVPAADRHHRRKA